MERIYVSYSTASGLPHLAPHATRHKILNYIDKDGNHHVVEAGPSTRFDNTWDKALAFFDEATDDNDDVDSSPYGPVIVYREKPEGETKYDHFPAEPIAEGEDLSQQWRLIQSFADRVERDGYEYRPLSRNSNSFVDQALEEAGLPKPTNAGTFPRDASGGEKGEIEAFWVPASERRYRYEDSYIARERADRPRAPVGTLSSGRPDDVRGSIRYGDETNALDVIGDRGDAEARLNAMKRAQRLSAPAKPVETDREGALETPLREASLRTVSPIAQARLPKLGRGVEAAPGASSVKAEVTPFERTDAAPAAYRARAVHEPNAPNPAAVAAVGPALPTALASMERAQGPAERAKYESRISSDDPADAKRAAMQVYVEHLDRNQRGDDETADAAIGRLSPTLRSTEEVAFAMSDEAYKKSPRYRDAVQGSIRRGLSRRTTREGRFTAFA